ncbi:MAG: hypothetical protein AB1469_00315 [Pseudomonadota bacterium]
MENLSELAFYGFWTVLLVICIVALLLGIGLLVKPYSLLQAGQYIKQRLTARLPIDQLQKPIKIERYVYRRHRFFGALILSGALFTLYSLIYRYNETAVISAYAIHFNRATVGWVVESMTAFLAITSVCAALIGAVMLIRPSLLKGVEAWANRRYPGPDGGKLLSVIQDHSQRFTTSHPRLAGFLISLISLFILANLLFVVN